MQFQPYCVYKVLLFANIFNTQDCLKHTCLKGRTSMIGISPSYLQLVSMRWERNLSFVVKVGYLKAPLFLIPIANYKNSLSVFFRRGCLYLIRLLEP